MAAPVAGSPSSPAGKRRKLRHTAVLSDSVKCEYNGGTMETIGERELWLVAVPWEVSVCVCYVCTWWTLHCHAYAHVVSS